MNTKKELIEAKIQELDKNHFDAIANQEAPNGTNFEVHSRVAQNMVNQRAYEIQRKNLVQMRDNSMGVSPGVLDFLAPKKVESKFDVENGTAKIDNSLQMEGRQIGRKI